MRTGELVSLSEQELVDCDHEVRAGGCNLMPTCLALHFPAHELRWGGGVEEVQMSLACYPTCSHSSHQVFSVGAECYGRTSRF